MRTRGYRRKSYGKKYGTYTTRRRRYTKKSYQRRAPKRWLTRWQNPGPHIAYYKLKYNSITQLASLSALNGYTADTVYNANSMYDPEAAIGGGQCYLWDQYCSSTAPFNRYKVLASKVKVFMHNVSSEDQPKCIRCSIFPSLTDTESQASFVVLANQPYVRQFVMENDNDTHNKMQNYCSTKKMWAVKDVDDVTFAAPYNANPTNRWYWHVTIDGSTQALVQDIKFDIEITYYVQLTQTQQPPPS